MPRPRLAPPARPLAPSASSAFAVGLAASFSALAAAAPLAHAAPSVWVIDDGEKIKADAVDTPFEQGRDNPVWQPGAPVRLFAMQNESVALQVVVEADANELEGVTVDLEALDGESRAGTGAPPPRLVDAPLRGRRARLPVGSPIERYVEHFVTVRRASGSAADPTASEGWEPGAGPDPKAWTGAVPDALVPIDAPSSGGHGSRAQAQAQASGDLYPMHVAPKTNGIVWIDLNVPRDQPAGLYRGAIRVRAGEAALATLPVELEVVDAMLPDRTVAATAGYDAEALRERLGNAAEISLWQMLHARRIAPLHDATSPQDLERQRAALDGSLYTEGRGYLGPAPTLGDGAVVIGARGAFGEPDERSMPAIESIARQASQMHLFGSGDVWFEVASANDDASAGVGARATTGGCHGAWVSGWRRLMQASAVPAVHRLALGGPCQDDPSGQPLDVPFLHATWDDAAAAAARRAGKTPWIAGGVLPRTGSFLLDADAVSPRVNGWLQAMAGVPRWIVPEIAGWASRRTASGVNDAGDAGDARDAGDGGDAGDAGNADEPADPFADPEVRTQGPVATWAEGGDTLVYPGRRRGVAGAAGAHPADLDGVLPSIRLDNWRRGIEDAGYLQLASEKDPARAAAVARWLIPAALSGAQTRPGELPSWGTRGKRFHDARRALLAIVLGRPAVTLPEASGGGTNGAGGASGAGEASNETTTAASARSGSASGCALGAGGVEGGATIGLLGMAAVAARARRVRRERALAGRRPAAS